jgi:hypothetical protein
MEATQEKPNEEFLPEAQRQLGQSAMIRVAITERIKLCTVSGTVATLFLLRLGATPFHIGILNSVKIICPLGNLIGLNMIPKTGKVRLQILCRLISIGPLLLLMSIALWGQAGVPAIWLAIGTLAVIDFVLTVGLTGWWPLLQDNTAGDKVGAFFARMRVQLRTMDIALPLLVGAYLGTRPTARQFIFPFGVAIAAFAIGTWFLRPVSELPTKVSQQGLIHRFGRVLAENPTRNFLIYSSLQAILTGLFFPFWVVKLNSQGLGSSYVIWLTSAIALGQVVFTRTWGRLTDDHGSRSVLTLSIIPQALLGLAWLVLPSGKTELLAWGLIFYLIYGFLVDGMLMGQTLAMMNAIPRKIQMDSFTLLQFVGAVGGSVGALLGGVFFQYLSTTHIKIGPADGQQLYLAITQMGLILMWVCTLFFKGRSEDTPTRELINLVRWRIYRTLPTG